MSKCDKCCDLYNNIDEDDDQYIIERLEDIVEISTYLIKVLKHKKMKKDMLDDIINKESISKSNEKDNSDVTNDFDAEEFLDFLKKISVNKTYPKSHNIYTGKPSKVRYPYYGGIWF